MTEAVVSQRLDTCDLPDPDLVIRTIGERRSSNFLPWQAADAEFEFTPTLWPDFKPAELTLIVRHFNNRERRFGDVARGESQADFPDMVRNGNGSPKKYADHGIYLRNLSALKIAG